MATSTSLKRNQSYQVSEFAFAHNINDYPAFKYWGHLVFDVKMDFTRKVRWVKDGHRTIDPDWSTYAGVVARDIVQIASTSPFPPNSRPELDTYPLLTPMEASYYQSLIGVLWWIVELGRIDITCEVSIMTSHMTMPRSNHLNVYIFERQT
jgi:hypothetical protein